MKLINLLENRSEPTPMTKKLSYHDAVCLLFTENFGDLLIFQKKRIDRKRACAIVKAKGINYKDPYDLDEEYSRIVEELAAEILPENWGQTFDYWGGKCFCRNPGWNAPQTDTVMAGDSGRYLCCTSEHAIREELLRYKNLECHGEDHCHS